MKGSPIRPTDDDARKLARSILLGARHAALATLQPDTGHPVVSRVAFATDADGVPISLMSTLALHTKALEHNSSCSLLLGEPGKGDPLAHPRLTIQAHAEKLPGLDKADDQMRKSYLSQHPKSELYFDFGDFFLFRFRIQSAYLNGGFGKAFVLRADDLVLG